MKKNKKWVKTRHRIATALVFPWFYLYAKIKYGVRFDKLKKDKRQYFIISNHQTPFDQFFIGLLLKKAVYYVATEDLYQKGFFSKLLHWAAAPIPIRKNSTDYKAVMTMLRVKKEGGSIAIFPEGNRTYSGKTGNVKDGIGGLVKALKLPVMVVNIKGGFLKHPRFSDCIRKGKMQVGVRKIIEYDEYKDLTNKECYDLVKSLITVNDYEEMKDQSYRSAKSAEYIERAMYVCPDCGISEFVSDKNRFECLKCGKTVNVDEKLKLSSKDGFPFSRICDWYDYQERFVENFDLSPYFQKPLWEERGNLFLTARYKKPKILQKNTRIKLYADRYEIGDGQNKRTFCFNALAAATAQGRNVLMFYEGDKVYQVKGSKRFNVLIFVNVYYHYKNNLRGDAYVQPSGERGTSREFLGL